MSIRNTKWINKKSKKQNEWIYHYLIKNCSQNPMQLYKEAAGVLVSEGKLATAEERLKMESAWRSYLSRQKTNKRNISINKEAYQLASTGAKRTNQSVGKYIESLIHCQQRSTSSPMQAEPVLAEPVLAEPVLAEPVLAEPVQAKKKQATPYQKKPNQRRNLN